MRSETERASQAAIQFRPDDKVLATEPAVLARCERRQWARHADRVAELHSFGLRKVFGGNEVFGNIPIVIVAAQNYLGLQFMSVKRSQQSVRGAHIGTLALNLFLNSAGLIQLLVLEIEHRIDPVLAPQNFIPVLPSPAGKHGAVCPS